MISSRQDLQRKLLQKQIKSRFDQTKKSLSLYKCKSWKEILGQRDWSVLKSLVLTFNQISKSNVEVLARHKWSSLQQLWLNENILDINGVVELLNNKFPVLQDLSLYNNKLQLQGILQVVRNLPKSVKKLNIGLNGMKPQICFKYPCSKLPLEVICITELNLNNNKFGSNGLNLMSKLSMPNLEKLNINQCEIGDVGVKALLKGCWKKLAHLQANYNKISLDGLGLLPQAHLIELSKLSLMFNLNTYTSGLNLMLLESKLICQNSIVMWGIRSKKFEQKYKDMVQSAKPNKIKQEQGFDRLYEQ